MCQYQFSFVITNPYLYFYFIQTMIQTVNPFNPIHVELGAKRRVLNIHTVSGSIEKKITVIWIGSFTLLWTNTVIKTSFSLLYIATVVFEQRRVVITKPWKMKILTKTCPGYSLAHFYDISLRFSAMAHKHIQPIQLIWTV